MCLRAAPPTGRPRCLGRLGLLAALAALVLPASAAGQGVSVFPIPGARVASPQTQISFRGLPFSALLAAQITVTGSRSGVHPGHLVADSDGQGGSFEPAHPFTAGERVTVTTSLPLLGTRGSAPGGLGESEQFTVAVPRAPLPALHWPAAARSPGSVQFFHSAHGLRPVSVTVTHPGAGRSGDIFLAPQWGPVQDGPMILDPNGQLVWFDPLPGDLSATDFRVQRYQGQPVLTWWQGTLVAGIGLGTDMIVNRSYQTVAVIRAGNGLQADEHEFQLTPAGTALVVAEYPVYWNATSVHGSAHQVVMDSVVQEIDIPTGLVLFQWDSLDHVPLTDTYSPRPPTASSLFDPYHVNSVALDDDGNLVISMRNTWAVYKINHATAATMWTLGGRHSSFRLAPGTYWAFQHDVRLVGTGDRRITMFDDDAGPPAVHSQSRAIEVALDLRHRTARQVTALAHTPPLSADYEGNDQLLPGGNAFVGWGQQPYFTQFDGRGDVVFDAHLNAATASYRVYRFPWSATPATRPSVTAGRQGSRAVVWVSWNGATGVVSWRVLGGASPAALRPLAVARRRGFETAITVPARPVVEVQALGVGRRVLATSDTATVH
jgi:hypothetical protein